MKTLRTIVVPWLLICGLLFAGYQGLPARGGTLPLLGAGKGASSAPPVAVTLSTTDRNPDIVLSNGNLTADSSNGSFGAYNVRATAGGTAGQKIYIEFVLNARSFVPYAGFSEPGAANLSVTIGSDFAPTAWGVNLNDGTYQLGGSPAAGTTLISTGTPGDVIGLAVNLTAQLMWARVNGGAWNPAVGGSQDPATNAGGMDTTGFFGETDYIVPIIGLSGSGDTVSIRVTAASWGTAAPSGYSEILP